MYSSTRYCLVESALKNYYDLKPLSNQKPKNLVIFLHGYGADGRDLISIGEKWKNHMPDTYFFSPNAPDIYEGDFQGNQWFSLNNTSPSAMLNGVQQTYTFIDSFILNFEKEYGISSDSIALVGFSQGAMVALSYGLQHSSKFAGIIGYSGSYISQKLPINSRPDVLLIHGDHDSVLPLSHFISSKEHLESLGVKVTGYIRENLGHGIDDWGLNRGCQFLREKLYE